MRTLFIAMSLLSVSSVASAQVDYASQIQPIFNARCTSCHGGTSGVILTSYAATMASVGNLYDKKIVIPGNADDSPLYDKLQAVPQIGSQMPQGGTLTLQQIQLIRTWINEGAHPVPTSVEDGERPMAMRLEQNFPNPFNPGTVIGFQLSVSGQTSLKVFDLTGREVAVMVDGVLPAGEHRVSFDAKDLPSGVYLYVLESGGQRISRKLMLMK